MVQTLAATLALAATVVQAASAQDRPFGPNAPWNVKVRGLPLHPNPAPYIARLWTDAPSERPGNFNLSFDDYTYPVYDSRQAERWFPVWSRSPSDLDGGKVPWSSRWSPAPGGDGQAIILDPEQGIEWDLFQVQVGEGDLQIEGGSRVPGDYRTRETGYRASRGAGIPYLAMLVRPHEIRAGVIPHALSMAVRNTDGAHAWPPATKLEHPGERIGLPEGSRFWLDVSDAQIEEWLRTLPPGVPLEARRSGRIIAQALRDYGWFITDTAGAAHLQFESRVSARQDWKELGLASVEIDGKEYPRDMLDGLITPERIRLVVPSDQYPAPLLARDR